LVIVAGTLSGAVQPPVATAAAAPKVAIIVGPVGGSTAGYKRDADSAAAAALRYTTNVVKVYTPNATWAAAKAAMQGASIVIYMGHGNGFPSPYSSTLAPDRQNGLGLNPTAGGDDTTTRYYGEDWLRREVRLAPNAVVLLAHLCYASGTSEPGKPAPTDSQARQRVDNYAAGFIAAGARTVIAEAYGSSTASYVDALFATRQNLLDMWLNSRSSQGNISVYSSTRTSGMTVRMDPDLESGKYYRSIVTSTAHTTEQVTGATAAPSDGSSGVPPADPSWPTNPSYPTSPTSPTSPTAPTAPAVPVVPIEAVPPAAETPILSTVPVPAPALPITLTTSAPTPRGAQSPVITWGEEFSLDVQFGANGANRTFDLQGTRDGVNWSTIATLTTDQHGRASHRYSPPTNLTYRAIFEGASDFEPAVALPVRTVVRQIALLRPTNNGATAPISIGTSIEFSTTVRPSRPELTPATVSFYYYWRTAGGWHLMARDNVVTDPAGFARSNFQFAIPGEWYVRAQANPTPYNANSVMSPPERFFVR
jgi:hypothetical protein